jgi:hypothetical protein
MIERSFRCVARSRMDEVPPSGAGSSVDVGAGSARPGATGDGLARVVSGDAAGAVCSAAGLAVCAGSVPVTPGAREDVATVATTGLGLAEDAGRADGVAAWASRDAPAGAGDASVAPAGTTAEGTALAEAAAPTVGGGHGSKVGLASIPVRRAGLTAGSAPATGAPDAASPGGGGETAADDTETHEVTTPTIRRSAGRERAHRAGARDQGVTAGTVHPVAARTAATGLRRGDVL